MTLLFNRKYRLQIGTIVIEDLTIDYTVKTDLKRSPNTATIKIWNLSENNRDQIDSLVREGALELKAGHETTGIGTIFIGDISRATSHLEKADWITTIEAGDGRRRSRTRRVRASHAPGSRVGDIVQQVGAALGVGQGNLDAITRTLTRTTRSTRTVSGNAADVLTRLAASEGLEWSIQRGNLQLLQRGRALAGSAIRLAPGTGLIGSPSRDKDGTISADANMMPDLFPGRYVRLESRRINADCRVERAEYRGNSRKGSWKIGLKMKEIE